MPGRLESWFKSQVLVHEDVFMRFLARAWPKRDELMDLRQEVYARVCEAAQHGLLQNPRAVLYAIARHVMSDRRRRERIVSIQAAGDYDFSNDLIEEKTPERYVGANQELMRVAEAFDSLPPRCREVIWMRRVLDLPQKEIAARLQIGEKAVEKQIVRGHRLLANFLLQPALAEADRSGTRVSDEKFLNRSIDEERP